MMQKVLYTRGDIRYNEVEKMNTQTQIRRIYLGIYYPDYGEWQAFQRTINYYRGECESEGLLYINGMCFDVNDNDVVDVYYEVERREDDGALMWHYYAVLRE